MSINSFSSIQNLINKKKAVAAAPVAGPSIATISNAQAPGPQQYQRYLIHPMVNKFLLVVLI